MFRVPLGVTSTRLPTPNEASLWSNIRQIPDNASTIGAACSRTLLEQLPIPLFRSGCLTTCASAAAAKCSDDATGVRRRTPVASSEHLAAAADAPVVRQPERNNGMGSCSSNVREQAAPIVEALSGICRMLLQSEASLGVGSLVEVTPSGTRNIFVELEPAVLRITGGMVSMQVIHADGSI